MARESSFEAREREILNLFPDCIEKNVGCAGFLDAYWAGEEIGPDDSRYLYNICPKRFEQMFEAIITGKFSQECQARYAGTVLAKLGQSFGFKKGKLIGNALQPFSDLYMPPILIFSIFTLDEPVYLTRIDLSWNPELLQSLLDVWKSHGIVRVSPFHEIGYHYMKFSLKKFLPTYAKLTCTSDIAEFRNQLSGQNLERFFIQGIRKSIQDGGVRVPMSLLEIFVIGYMFRLITRSRKIKSFLSEAALTRVVWTFSYRTGIDDTAYLEEFRKLLISINESSFINDVVSGKLARFVKRTAIAA
jgi:hypothetical protein